MRFPLVTTTGLALSLGFAVGAAGQTNSALQCVYNAGVPPAVRAEGLTELVGDVLLNCTGGVGLPNGAAVPQTNIRLILNTNVTNAPGQEALLVVDEPGTTAPANATVTGFGTGAPAIPCTNSAGCPAFNQQMLGLGGLTYNVLTATPSPTSGPAPNVYRGAVSRNSVTFFGVPIDPPGTTGTRVFRITNVRANALAVGAVGNVLASVSASNLPITLNQFVIGTVQSPATCNPAAIQGAYAVEAHDANSSFAGYVFFNGHGGLNYLATANRDGEVFRAVQGGGSYTVGLIGFSCQPSINLNGLPIPEFRSFDSFPGANPAFSPIALQAVNSSATGIAVRTNLLYPFVTNQAGFDTGLAISNTSCDPYGTSSGDLTGVGGGSLTGEIHTNGGSATVDIQAANNGTFNWRSKGQIGNTTLRDAVGTGKYSLNGCGGSLTFFGMPPGARNFDFFAAGNSLFAVGIDKEGFRATFRRSLVETLAH